MTFKHIETELSVIKNFDLMPDNKRYFYFEWATKQIEECQFIGASKQNAFTHYFEYGLHKIKHHMIIAGEPVIANITDVFFENYDDAFAFYNKCNAYAMEHNKYLVGLNSLDLITVLRDAK